LFRIKLSDHAEADKLLKPEEYLSLVQG
jgi:hypothetical protein